MILKSNWNLIAEYTYSLWQSTNYYLLIAYSLPYDNNIIGNLGDQLKWQQTFVQLSIPIYNIIGSEQKHPINKELCNVHTMFVRIEGHPLCE